jgi:hypothetical protein
MVIAWTFAAIAIFFIALMFLPYDSETTTSTQLRNPIPVYLSGAAFFSFLSWEGFRTARYLRFSSITVDKDGLWFAYLSKERGLIPWLNIADIKEHQSEQCLAILDKNGNTLLKLSYKLDQFDQLRAIVQEKTSTHFKSSKIPITLARSSTYHLLTVSSLVGLSLFGWYSGKSHPFLGYIAIAIIAAASYEYLTSAWKVIIARDRLIMQFPIFSREYSYTEIKSVQLCDSFFRGIRHPEVGITIDERQRLLRLKGLGVDATTLHHIISAAWKEYPQSGAHNVKK